MSSWYSPEAFKYALEFAIKEANKATRYFDLYDFWDDPVYYTKEPVELYPGITVKIVDWNQDIDYSEDFTRGEPVWNVFEITFKDGSKQYFRRDGMHQSWDSDEWSDLYEVVPKQKTITVFEKE